MRPQLRLKVVMGPFHHWFRTTTDKYRKRKDEIFTKAGPRGIELLAAEAPKRTGKFAGNFQFDRTGDRMWWFNPTRTEDGILLDLLIDRPPGGPDRTRASPGRYVPAIGKRLVSTSSTKTVVVGGRSFKITSGRNIGMHPGAKRTPYYTRAWTKLKRWLTGEFFK